MNPESKKAATTATNKSEAFTMEMLDEAMELIKALSPKEAPPDALFVRGVTGLNIMKSDFLPENTIMVSKRLFDMIYEASKEGEK